MSDECFCIGAFWKEMQISVEAMIEAAADDKEERVAHEIWGSFRQMADELENMADAMVRCGVDTSREKAQMMEARRSSDYVKMGKRFLEIGAPNTCDIVYERDILSKSPTGERWDRM